MRYKDTIEIDGIKLTKPYIYSLNREQREALIIPLFNKLREIGFLYPDMEEDNFRKSYKKLVDFVPDLSKNEIYNNSSLATDICRYFCKVSFYNVTENKNGKRNLSFYENFMNDETLKKICRNRLGLGWYDSDPLETFNLTPKMIMFQAQRSMRLVPQISFFKPGIAKAIYLKYSNDGDIVYDYSCGFGARVLGALSCGRRYIGIDPLTTSEVSDMLKFLNISEDRYKLINGISEDYCMGEECVDFIFSSPPYYDQEVYSSDINQAYNKGEDYFYNTYWVNTLKNCKKMLKSGKYFGFNISNKYDRMLDIAKVEFGDIVDIFYLRTVRSHLNKSGKEDAQKYEPVYIFKKL